MRKTLLFALPIIAGFTAAAQCDGVATFTDARDGQIYNQITIGSQCWMAENLNIGTMINSCSGGSSSNGTQTNNGTIEKYCNGCSTPPICPLKVIAIF